MAPPHPLCVAVQLYNSPCHVITIWMTLLSPWPVGTLFQPFFILSPPVQVKGGHILLHSGVPSRPSIVSPSSPYPQPDNQTSPSVADSPPPCVSTLPQIISPDNALSPLWFCKVSWQTRHKVREGVVVALPFHIRGPWSDESVVACHSQGCSGSTSCNRRLVYRLPRLSATAPSILSAYPEDHRFPSCTAGSMPRSSEDAALQFFFFRCRVLCLSYTMKR